MTQWGLDTLFNPAKRHMDEEKRRLQSTREEVGDSSGGKRIDLESGKVTIKRPSSDDADDTDNADDTDDTDETVDTDHSDASSRASDSDEERDGDTHSDESVEFRDGASAEDVTD